MNYTDNNDNIGNEKDKKHDNIIIENKNEIKYDKLELNELQKRFL